MFFVFIKFIISRTGRGERFLTLFLASSLKNSAIQKILTNISSVWVYNTFPHRVAWYASLTLRHVNISSELLKYDSSVSTMTILLCKPGFYKSELLLFQMWHKLQLLIRNCKHLRRIIWIFLLCSPRFYKHSPFLVLLSCDFNSNLYDFPFPCAE